MAQKGGDGNDVEESECPFILHEYAMQFIRSHVQKAIRKERDFYFRLTVADH
jgi:hypothetical protein